MIACRSPLRILMEHFAPSGRKAATASCVRGAQRRSRQRFEDWKAKENPRSADRGLQGILHLITGRLRTR